MILFDTNVCIAILHANDKVLAHVRGLRDVVGVPAMVVGELFYGVAKSDHVEVNRRMTERLLSAVKVIQTSDEVMHLFGYLKAGLEKRGTRIDDADVLIAATALSQDAVLATGNIKHFSRFDGLRIENWFT